MSRYPKVTLAVPLYRSAQFLPILTETLEHFAYPDLEFVISDRHCADGAMERLQELFGTDARFRFLAARDELDWVAHYNLLLREASGEYFVWVSHDDSYSTNFVQKLVEALEKQPDAVVAYARAERISMAGEPVEHIPAKIPDARMGPGPVTAYRVALSGGLQFHGMFRRNWLVSRELWLRPTDGNIAADMLWIFTVAMLGKTVYVDDCVFRKRYYSTSTHKRWGAMLRGRHIWNFAGVARSYAQDYCRSNLQRLCAVSVIYATCALWRVKLCLWKTRGLY